MKKCLLSPAEGNRKYITGTNTPRASRSNAYYELLCKQQTNGYRSPAIFSCFLHSLQWFAPQKHPRYFQA